MTTLPKSSHEYLKQDVGHCCGANILYSFPYDLIGIWKHGFPTKELYGESVEKYVQQYKQDELKLQADLDKLRMQLPYLVTNKITIAITRSDQSGAAKVLEEFGFKPVEEWFYTNGTGLRVYIYLKDSANKPKEWAKKE